MEPIKLRCKYVPGAGREIQALLPRGFKLEHTDFRVEEEFWTCIWSERWVQFPTEDWEVLQDRVMHAIEKVLRDIEREGKEEDPHDPEDPFYAAGVRARRRKEESEHDTPRYTSPVEQDKLPEAERGYYREYAERVGLRKGDYKDWRLGETGIGCAVAFFIGQDKVDAIDVELRKLGLKDGDVIAIHVGG